MSQLNSQSSAQSFTLLRTRRKLPTSANLGSENGLLSKPGKKVLDVVGKHVEIINCD